MGYDYQKRLKRQREKKRQAMLRLWAKGKTLGEIGALYNVSRERIRQILGTTRETGGAHKRGLKGRIERNTDSLKKATEKAFKDYGCSLTEYARIRGNGPYFGSPVSRYSKQRGNASLRGIGWNLTLPEWWLVWQNSGKWEERGKGKYVMCRIRDTGPYEIGNVRIATARENALEAINLAGGGGKWGANKPGAKRRVVRPEARAKISARVKEQWAKRKAAGFNKLGAP